MPTILGGESISEVVSRLHANLPLDTAGADGSKQLVAHRPPPNGPKANVGAESRLPTTMAKTRGCWASVLGECRGRLTREHRFPLASWSTGDVDDPAAGRDVRARVPVTIVTASGALRSLTANDLATRNLCEFHNSLSSDLDAELGRFREAHNALRETHRERRHDSSAGWELRRLPLDGPLNGLKLERSFMKVVVNDFESTRQGIPIGGHHAEPDRPTRTLAEMIFGHSRVRWPYGLWVDYSRSRMDLDNQRRIHSVFAGHGARRFLAAALVWFLGHRFAVVLSETWPTIELIDSTDQFRGARFLQPYVENATRPIGAQIVIEWPEERRRRVEMHPLPAT